jgi:hypothetical protein
MQTQAVHNGPDNWLTYRQIRGFLKNFEQALNFPDFIFYIEKKRVKINKEFSNFFTLAYIKGGEIS